MNSCETIRILLHLVSNVAKSFKISKHHMKSCPLKRNPTKSNKQHHTNKHAQWNEIIWQLENYRNPWPKYSDNHRKQWNTICKSSTKKQRLNMVHVDLGAAPKTSWGHLLLEHGRSSTKLDPTPPVLDVSGPLAWPQARDIPGLGPASPQARDSSGLGPPRAPNKLNCFLTVEISTTIGFVRGLH